MNLPYRKLLAAVALATFSAAFGENAQAVSIWNIGGTGNGAGNWNTNANWDPNTAFPNGVGVEVSFEKSITSNRTINVSDNVTIGSLTAGDPTGPTYNHFTIASNNTTTRTLTFDADDGNVNTLDVVTINRKSNSGGRLTIGSNTSNVNLQLNDPLVITWASNAGDLAILGTISGPAGNPNDQTVGITVRSGGSQGDQVRLDGTSSATYSYAGDTTLDGGYIGVWTAARLPFGAGKGNVNVNNNNLEVSTLAFWATGTHNINGLNGDGLVVQVGNPGDQLTLQVGNGDADGTFSGVVRLRTTLAETPEGRVFSFAKTGTGTQVLSGDNLYNGTTTVSGGTLLVNGTHASANLLDPDATPGAYTVLPTGAGPAILGGTGTISSTVNLSGVSESARGTIAPGASAGEFTIGGLSLGDYASLAFELDPSLAGSAFIGGSDNDLLDVTGVLDLSGALASTIELNVQDVGGGDFDGLGTWYLVKFNPLNLSDDGFDYEDVVITGLGAGYTGALGVGVVGSDTYLTLTVVPEPNSLILTGLGLIGLARVVRRKQK